MSEHDVVDNTELVGLIELGLRKGYWDKALIPELKKRFEEFEKKEKLLELYKDLSNYVCEQCYAHELLEITRLKIIIKELEK